MAEQQGIGPNSYAVDLKNAGGGTPQADGGVVNSINPSNQLGGNPGNLTAFAPGGNFGDKAAWDSSLVKSLADVGQKLLEPMIEKKKEEYFWQGVQRQANGESVADIKKQNPLAKIFGDGDQTKGARFYRVNSQMSELMTGFEKDMPELAKMSPEEASKYMVNKSNELMTDDPDTNATLGVAMAKFLPDLMRTQATARYKYQESELNKSQFEYDSNQLVRMSSQQAMLMKGETTPEQFTVNTNSIAQEIITRRVNETDSGYETRIKNVVTTSLESGNLSLVDLMQRSGVIFQLAPETQLNIERAAKAAENKSKVNFLSANAKLYSDYEVARAQASTVEERVALDEDINAKLRIYSGGFTRENFDLVDIAKSQTSDRIELYKSEVKSAEEDRVRSIQDELGYRELEIYAKAKDGRYGSGEDAIQNQENDRLVALQFARDAGLSDSDIPDSLKSPIPTYNRNWEAVESQRKAELAAQEKQRAENDKRKEWLSEIENASQNIIGGQDGVAMSGLDAAQKTQAFEAALNFSDPTGEDIGKQMPVVIKLANGVDSYVNPRMKNILTDPFASTTYNPKRVGDSIRILDTMLESPMGASAAEKYYGKENLEKILEFKERINGADIKEADKVYTELFSPTYVSGRRGVTTTTEDYKVARAEVSKFQPGWIWGTTPAGVPALGSSSYEGSNLRILEEAYAQEYAYIKKTFPNYSEERIKDNAISSVKARNDVINQFVIRRPEGFPALQSVLIAKNRSAKWDPIEASKVVRDVVTEYPGGKFDPANNYIEARMQNGKPIYLINFNVELNGQSEPTILALTGDEYSDRYTKRLFDPNSSLSKAAEEAKKVYHSTIVR